MAKCENCGNENIEMITKEVGYICGNCGRNTECLTNADKIRNMTDEELAKFLMGIENETLEGETWEYESVCLHWLQSEAD